jgi:beta-N-acetylhexosaminidase
LKNSPTPLSRIALFLPKARVKGAHGAAPRGLSFILVLLQLGACSKNTVSEDRLNAENNSAILESEIHSAIDNTIRAEARRIAETLSPEELAGQIIMSGIDANGPLSEEEKQRISDVKPGAIMLFRKNLNTTKERILTETNDINALYNDIKPFIAVDHEGGDVHRFTEGVERLPSPYSYFVLSKKTGQETALLKIKRDAERAAREIAALGINMNLAPVAELLNNDNKQFLDERSYGDDTSFVIAASNAFIDGMRRGGVVCVIKHFPGNSGDDPHKKRPVLRGTENDLHTRALPFYTIIKDAAPAGVMISHAIVEAWDKNNNASLSPVVIEKLKAESGFAGIVLADDFSMGAVLNQDITQTYITAVNSGCDMVMAWPNNVRAVHAALSRAIRSGAITHTRATDAAARIISIAACSGFHPRLKRVCQIDKR